MAGRFIRRKNINLSNQQKIGGLGGRENSPALTPELEDK